MLDKDERQLYSATLLEDVSGKTGKLTDPSNLRQSLQQGQLTGSARFVDEVEEKIKRRLEFRGQGRPGKVLK